MGCLIGALTDACNAGHARSRQPQPTDLTRQSPASIRTSTCPVEPLTGGQVTLIAYDTGQSTRHEWLGRQFGNWLSCPRVTSLHGGEWAGRSCLERGWRPAAIRFLLATAVTSTPAIVLFGLIVGSTPGGDLVAMASGLPLRSSSRWNVTTCPEHQSTVASAEYVVSFV